MLLLVFFIFKVVLIKVVLLVFDGLIRLMIFFEVMVRLMLFKMVWVLNCLFKVVMVISLFIKGFFLCLINFIMVC